MKGDLGEAGLVQLFQRVTVRDVSLLGGGYKFYEYEKNKRIKEALRLWKPVWQEMSSSMDTATQCFCPDLQSEGPELEAVDIYC